MTTAALAADPDRLNWDDLVLDGIDARKRRDGAQWELGDLAREVETSYGGGELETYAEQIGVEYNALREYERIASQFEFATRVADVSWTHHRVVVDREDRMRWIRLAAENSWSSRKMLAEIEEEDERQREEADRRAQVERLKAQSADLASAVEKGEMPIAEALAESALRDAKARQERDEHAGRIRRSVARINQLLIGWIELESLRDDPEREEILAALDAKDRKKVLEIESRHFGGA